MSQLCPFIIKALWLENHKFGGRRVCECGFYAGIFRRSRLIPGSPELIALAVFVHGITGFPAYLPPEPALPSRVSTPGGDTAGPTDGLSG
jgi:hypothetical protein